MRRLALLAVALSTAAAFAQEPRNAALHAFFEREFQVGLQEHPERGTRLGLEGYDDRWTDHSAAAVARRKAHVKQALDELARIDAASLGRQDRISRELFLYRLRMQQEELAFFGDLPFEDWLPVSTMEGPQFTVPSAVKSMRFRAPRDYDNYLKRLAAIPALLDQEREGLEAAAKAGWVAPCDAMPRVPGMLSAFTVADVTSTPLWRPFESFPATVGDADRKRYAEQGRRVLTERVHPAFTKLQRYLEHDYLPTCGKSLSASRRPGGKAYYAFLVRESTTTDLTPEEVHAIGLQEVARIRGEMDRVIASTGFKGSFQEFIHYLDTDPRFFFKTPEARLMAYRDIAKRADAALPPLFAELPRTPYGIRAMEAYEGDNADHYSSGAIDGSRAGFFEANVNNLSSKPSHEMEAVLLHEAVPGHHLQIARAQELKDLPRFRRSGGYTAYSEGWALYAESLGEEMGFYTDPYMRFGRLMAEMLRACRLVIDTGLHSKDWTREQSIRYLVDNGGANPEMAAAEIDRYIVIPGQALGYKIGELKIKALRAKAKAALGPRFDVRRFHNAVLDDGALPLAILEQRIDEWIRAQ